MREKKNPEPEAKFIKNLNILLDLNSVFVQTGLFRSSTGLSYVRNETEGRWGQAVSDLAYIHGIMFFISKFGVAGPN